ncbi:hypothetical protein PHACT_01640 [Pseudohongiella acticola]|uniref:Prephenate/arogenate dehydrogenase domain-containing protein n=1 Tax=Pseudohongiella acticola TaxID=1524254 RepID=A0A1E8CI11_9GAMM|nr:prephenate dehydrogenase/arogenate dehydrogenase family protein [Pseudohongiella acticola]OFE12002.1 hypothetical protein PHACT_01640 [Pseudohongiella acticola]
MTLLKNKTVLIVGLGLIGGSIARGLAASNACQRILAVGRDETVLHTAMLDGSIHAYATDLATLAPEADLIMITVPTQSVRAILEQLIELVDDSVIITDAASVKGNVVADARQVLRARACRFVPGHPIAGSERSGYPASRADLFDKRKVILTPQPDNDTDAVRTVMALWQCLGADIHAMSAERHDRVLAGTSHLPHLLAFALVNTLVDSISEPDRVQQVFDYAAGGFADFSRIASSDPVMWRDIFLANSQATVDILDAYIESLQKMRSVLLRADGAAMTREFSRAKHVRDEFYQRFQKPETKPRVFAEHSQDTGSLVCRPSLSLQGEFRAAASVDTARQYLQDAACRDAVTLLRGIPEDGETLALIQALRAAGVPVVGPEQASVTVYGSEPDADLVAGQGCEAEQTTNNRPLSPGTELPANDFVILALALAASSVAESRLTLRCVYAGADGHEHPLQAFQQMGADLQLMSNQDSGQALLDVLVKPSALDSCELDFSVIAGDVLPEGNKLAAVEEQVLGYIVAGMLADGKTCLRVANLADNARITGAITAWQALGANIEWTDDVITVSRSLLASGVLACRNDPEFTLLCIVLAQRVSGRLELTGFAAFVDKYPGLLAQLQKLGFGLALERTS